MSALKTLKRIASIILLVIWAPAIFSIYTNNERADASRWLGGWYAHRAETAFYDACGATLILLIAYWILKFIISAFHAATKKAEPPASLE